MGTEFFALLKAFSRETNLWETLGYFTVKMPNLERESVSS